MVEHTGVLIGLILLIGCVILCHMSRLLNFNNSKANFYNITTPAAGITTYSNPANRIIYQSSTEKNKYCPGSHPYIPCDLVKNCPNKSKLTKEQEELITMYAYLSGLIKSVDIYNFKPAEAWFQ